MTYENLKEKPKEFLAATGLTVKEFELVLPIFHIKYTGLFEAGKTRKGKPRRWHSLVYRRASHLILKIAHTIANLNGSEEGLTLHMGKRRKRNGGRTQYSSRFLLSLCAFGLYT